MYSIIDYSERAIALTGDTKSLANQLKNLGGKFNPRLSCGAGWILSKKQEPALREFLASLDFPQEVKTDKKPKDCEELYKNSFKDYLMEFPKNAGEYWIKEVKGALRIGGGYFFAHKPCIDTEFWFHDEGSGYELYCEVTKTTETKKEYFIQKNTNKIKFSDEHKFYIVDDFGKIHSDTYYRLQERWHDRQIFQFSAEELEEIRKFYEWQKQLLQKRLDTYIKRWGVEKLEFDTYWADR